jgi:hypothetical protein
LKCPRISSFKNLAMKKFLPLFSIFCIYILQGCKKEIKNTDRNTELASTVASKGGQPSTSSIVQWQKSYGSSANEMGFAIANAIDGSGYVLAGSTSGNNGDVTGNKGGTDAWIVKIDLNGNLLWQKTFGGSGSDWAYDIVATADGGYVFSGTSSSVDGDLASLTNHGGTDTWVVKLSGNGDVIWQQELGGSGTERGESIIATTDGGFVVGGYSNSNDGDLSLNHGDYDACLIKLNALGSVEWQKLYGGSAYEAVGSMIETASGFTVCASAASSNGDLSLTTPHGGRDVWIYTIDAQGNFISGKTYGGSGGEDGGQIYTLGDGYVFSATTSSNNADVSGNHGYVDTWLVKTGAARNITWQKCYGGTDMDNARICSVDASGNIVLTGYTFSRSGDIPGSKGSEDMWVLKTDANGNKIYSGVLGGKNGDMSNAAIPTTDGKFISAGRSNSTSGDVTGNHGGEDMWVVKFGL